MTTQQLKLHWETTIAAIKNDPTIIRDKMWRLENLYVIQTKRGQKEIFKLNRAQRHFLENIKHRNIILKSRQLGFSTLITLFLLDEVLFTTNKDAIAIAHVKEGMTDIFDKKAKFAILNMPDEMKNTFNFSYNSKTKLQIQFKGGSTSTFAVGLSGRGGTYHHVHVSEYAKLSKKSPERSEEVLTGTIPAVPFDGYIFIESTAEGASGNFYDLYMRALESKSVGVNALYRVEFYPHFYNWTWDDMELAIVNEIIPISAMKKCEIDWEDYQKVHGLTDKEMTYYYMKFISLNGDIDRLNQEFPTTEDEAFVSTGKPYFDMRKIVTEKQAAVMPEYFDVVGREIQDVYNGPLMVWHKPVKGKQYVLGADTSEGLSHGDNATIAVVDVETRDICALFQAKCPPDEFHDVCFTVGQWYNNAVIAVETNKDGNWVNNELQRNGYPNLYFRQKLDDITKSMGHIFGWRTGKDTRDSMLTELRSVYNSHPFVAAPLLDEMMTFVRNQRGKPEAISGKHDDLIMAAAIAYMVRKLWFVEDFKSTNKIENPKSRMDIIFRNY